MLKAGTRLGPYDVLSSLGTGGMGEVYRARDTRLGRDVAIKVLPAEFAADPERLKRFEREARATAALSHPNILAVHDVGTHDGVPYLIEELLEGESLRERIATGGLTVGRSVEVGIQIARGLAAAHEHGIVHRDLKPDNVFATRDGTVKILDFGLAKLTQAVDGEAATGATGTDTASGLAVGTVGYMAPEQIRLQPVDHRADIFAFGCVLYEMLTGQRAFARDTAAETMTAILTEPAPEVCASGVEVAPELNRIVAHCLEKNPAERFQSASDIAFDLRALASAPTGAPRQFADAGAVRARLRPIVLVGVALGALGLGIVLTTIAGRVTGPRAERGTPKVVRALLDVAPAEELNAGGTSSSWLPTPGGSRTALAWTSDGRALVFVGRRGGVQRLYVRALDAPKAQAIAGTEGAQVPVVSTDGRWVAFWAQGAIKKVAVSGGPATQLFGGLDYPPFGIAWGADGSLLLGNNRCAISRVVGDKLVAVTTLGVGEILHRLPQWLPGEASFFYTVRSRDSTWGGESVVAQNTATGERTVVLRDAVDAKYVAGYLVFMRMGTLFAVAFDPTTLKVRGEPVALVADVAQALTSGHCDDVTGAGQFAVAPTGSLAYIEGPVIPYPDAQLVAVDRSGQVTALQAPRRSYAHFVRVSPDGNQVAVVVRSLAERGLWLSDLRRGILTKLPGGGEVTWSSWKPDGQRIIRCEIENGEYRLSWQRADGSGAPERLADDMLFPGSWSPDGRELVAVKYYDLWTLTLQEDGGVTLRPLVQTPAAEYAPAISPDGRWLAYQSDFSGRFEVYVQPYPGPGPRVQVSVDGGANPAWHPGGRQLFFLGLAGKSRIRQMMAVELTSAAPLRVSRPRTLFTFDDSELFFPGTSLNCYDVAPDGEHFCVTQRIPSPPTQPVTHIHLVLNWLDEVKARLAATSNP